MPYADSADKAAWAARYHAEHREEVNRTKARWARRNRLKRRAHIVVGNALRGGRLTRGDCERAGVACSGQVEAHHDDYREPLKVRWLCDYHHKQLHTQERELARAA